MPSNRAAWQDKPGVKLAVRETPCPSTLAADQVLIKARAWALNPCDWFIQDMEIVEFVKYPLILGEDYAGEVVQAGSEAGKRFRKGDRVFALGVATMTHQQEEGAFQEYVVAYAHLTVPIPESMSFAQGAVFPLTLATASHALYNKNWFGFANPQLEATKTGKTLVILGGASSVGSNAIQLATASGLTVWSTCKPHNFDLVKGLGAARVFDYSSATVVDEIVAALEGVDCAGVFQAAGPVEPAVAISAAAKAQIKVVTANPVPEQIPEGVEASWVYSTTLFYDNEIGPYVWQEYLPQALAQGKYQAAPQPLVVEQRGLEGIQAGLEQLRGGVSAKKVVILSA